MKILSFCFLFIWAYIIFVTYINCIYYINFNNILSFNIQKNNNYFQCFRNEYIEEYKHFKKGNSIFFKIQNINNFKTCDKINQLMSPKNISINNDIKNIKYNYKNNKCYLMCYDAFHNFYYSEKNENLKKKLKKNNACNNYIINLNQENFDQIYKYDTQEIESILYFLKIYTKIINHDTIKIVRNVHFFKLTILDLRNSKVHKIEEILISSKTEKVTEIDKNNQNLFYFFNIENEINEESCEYNFVDKGNNFELIHEIYSYNIHSYITNISNRLLLKPVYIDTINKYETFLSYNIDNNNIYINNYINHNKYYSILKRDEKYASNNIHINKGNELKTVEKNNSKNNLTFCKNTTIKNIDNYVNFVKKYLLYKLYNNEQSVNKREKKNNAYIVTNGKFLFLQNYYYNNFVLKKNKTNSDMKNDIKKSVPIFKKELIIFDYLKKNISYIIINENGQRHYNYSVTIKNNIVDLKNVHAHDFKRFSYFNKLYKVLDINHSKQIKSKHNTKNRKKLKKHYNMQNDSTCVYPQYNEHEQEKSFFDNNGNHFCYFKNMGLNTCTLGNEYTSLKTKIVILDKQISTLEVIVKKTNKAYMDNYLKAKNKSNRNILSTNKDFNYRKEIKKNMNIARKKKNLSHDDTKKYEQVSQKTYKNYEHNNIYQINTFNSLWREINKYLYIMYVIIANNINNYIFQLIDAFRQYKFYTNNIKYEHTQNIISYSYKPEKEIDKHFIYKILFTILKDIEFVNFFNTPEKNEDNHNLKDFNVCKFDYIENFKAKSINPFITKKKNMISNTCIDINLTIKLSRCYFVSYEMGDYLIQVNKKIKIDDDDDNKIEEIIIDSIISEHEKKVIENMKARLNYSIDFPLYLNKIYPDIYNTDCNIFNKLKWVLSIFLIPSWVIIILIYIIMSQEIWRHELLNPLHKLLLSPSIIRLSSFIILLIFCNFHCYYMYNKIMEYAILAFMTLNTLFNTLFFGNLLLISKGYMITRRYFSKHECLFLTLTICYIYILISFNQLNIVNDTYMLIYLHSFLLCMIVANIFSIINFLNEKLAYVRNIGMYNWERSIYIKINMYKHYLFIVIIFFLFEMIMHILNITLIVLSRNIALIQYTIEFIMWASVLYIFRYREDVLYYSILYGNNPIKTIPLYICNYKEESKNAEFDIEIKKEKYNIPLIILNPLEFPNQNLLSSLDVGWIIRYHYQQLNI
ncbi:conserved Plasmodium protein, unknown function [Plasmodium berghei]|uniref:Uncharacterized protein n=1 Tax=Plasmodium berghei TaxID=5821 RepID=A0A122INJ7_PLABE|nr:conserved Plasmodium protein, unknown function [Plasmodium berghei]